MCCNTRSRTLILTIGAALVCLMPTDTAWPCGGFFCRQVPIDQAGEQIIFRQDGDMVTAVILIQYVGDADDFSWVVPVPGVPELSTGSDLVFAPLELATRPQFVLNREGAPCPPPFFALGGFAAPLSPSATVEDAGGVDVLERLAVGPFDVEVVGSDDPQALVTWLGDNGYDLTDQGAQLIPSYVAEGKNFVALKLRQDQGVGDIQPLIMRYASDTPCIPIRLTAVAAQPDMGVIVWLLGASRAVPLNYLHVTPNYTRLNWYAGTQNAYASYQGLITAAMDEAGGQGFATDYAGRDVDVLAQLPTVDALGEELTRLSAITDDAEFFASLSGGFVFSPTSVLEILRRQLPLPVGDDDFIYGVASLLRETFTDAELAAARTAVVVELNDTIIDPLAETLAVFDGDPYMTRFFTTLSPEEMTLDPTFSFNPDLGDQTLVREATMAAQCTLSGGRWSLTLGPGTGRDGELVIEGTGTPPGFSPPTIAQDAVWRSEMLATAGPPSLVNQKTFPVAQVSMPGASGPLLCGAGTGACGTGALGMLLVSMLALRFMRRRR